MPYKQVDAAIKVILGPLIDDTDFKTREEGIAYNEGGMEIDVILEKHDGTVVTTAVVPTVGGDYDWAHTDQGYYELELPAAGGATFNNTEEGIIRVVGYCTGVLPFSSVSYDVVPEQIYDSIVKGIDTLQGDVIEVRGVAQSAIDLKDFADEGYNPATNKVTGVLLTDTTTAVTNDVGITQAGADKAWATAARILTASTNFNDITAAQAETACDNALATYDPPTKAEMDTGHGLLATEAKQDIIDTNVDDIEADTNEIQISLANGGFTDLLIDAIKAETALIVADTNELQVSLANGGFTDLLIDAIKAETALIVADTNELQTDWKDGGRLDLLIDAIKVTTDSLTDLATLVDAVWDEVLTGATHNIATSAGKRLRQAGVDAALIREDTCQAGSTASTIKLDAAASAVNNFYDHMWVYITDHTGAGQVRTMHAYDGATKIADIYPDWLTTPDVTSDFNIISLGSSHVHELENIALAQINAECDTALTDYDPPTKAEMDAGHALLATEAKQDIIDTNVDDIEADTNELQTDWVNGGRLDLLIDAIKTITDALPDAGALNDLALILTDTDATIPALIAALNNLSAAQAETACDNALATYDPPTKLEMDNAHALLATEAKQDIIDTNVDDVELDTGTTIPATITTLQADVTAVKAKTDNLPSGVTKNAALSNFAFLMVLSADHITPAAGLAITAQISKDGLAFAGCANAVVEVANGVYRIDLTAGEMNADIVVLKFTEATCDQRTITMVTS